MLLDEVDDDEFYPIEDTFEKLKEQNFISILKTKYTKSSDFLIRFPVIWSFDNSKTNVYDNTTWTDMKTKFGWGFSSGKCISCLIDWIFIRPDLKTSLANLQISLDSIISHGILNYHFFIVKTKAVNYFLSACTSDLLIYESSDDDADDANDSEVNIIVPFGIDDEAIETDADSLVPLKKQKSH